MLWRRPGTAETFEAYANLEQWPTEPRPKPCRYWQWNAYARGNQRESGTTADTKRMKAKNWPADTCMYSLGEQLEPSAPSATIYTIYVRSGK